MWRKYITWVIIIIIVFAIGYGLGFTKGSFQTMIWGLEIADNFIVDIEFDEEALAAGIFNYKNRITRCFDTNPLGET